MDTYTRKIIEIVSYVHKKFGSIEIKVEGNKTKIEILDVVGANPPKRVKVEALKYGSQGSYVRFGNSHAGAIYTKPPNMQPFSTPPVIKLNPFQQFGRPNGFQHIFHHSTMRPSLWFTPQQPNVNLNINQLKIPRVSTAFPMCLPTFNSNNNSDERNSKVNFKPTTAQHKIMFPLLVNTKHTPIASNCMLFSKPTQNEPDSTTAAKHTPNKNNDTKETTLDMAQDALKASLLQIKEGLFCNPGNKFLNVQPSLTSNMPQGVLKLLSAQQSSPKFPFVKISRPSPLLCKKLKERQLYIKLQNCGANVNKETQTKNV